MDDTTAEPEQQFTAAEALKLVSAYFDKEWPQLDLKDVQLQKITGGFVNRLHLLSRSNAAHQEPASILIRHFGQGNKTFEEQPLASNTTLSAAEQNLLYHEMGRRGWGPKLYGLFKGGRLEEYIDAHPLTAAEATQEAIRRDVARSYARLHSLQLPLRRKNFSLVVGEFKKVTTLKGDKVVRKLLSFGYPAARNLAKIFREMDWANELDWLSSLFEKHNCVPALAVGDTNFLNVLVKNHPSDCQIVLIDYETCTYSYRGIDIGGHFNEHMYCWSDPNTNLTGFEAPGLEEQRDFCRVYLEEMRALGLELGENDTVEHLQLEARIGGMWQLLFSVLMGFGVDLPDVKELLEGLGHMMGEYGRLKGEFCK